MSFTINFSLNRFPAGNPRRILGVLLPLAFILATGCDGDLKKKKDGPYVPPAICAEAIQLPKLPAVWIDDTHATGHTFDDSDFVLDREGNLVSVDRKGNVIRRAHDGTVTVLAEHVVRTGRGLAYLSTGELVVADSGRGMLVKVYPDGQSRILVPHLDYPNGLDVDQDDTIYVSESSRGAISRVNPRSGALTTVAAGLPMSPNGLSFSPDYKTLYVVGSDTAIYAMTRDEAGTWGPLEKFATVPGVALPCDGKVAGDTCSENGFTGVCQDDGMGGLACISDTSCAGKVEGDECGNRIPGVCTAGEEGALFCREMKPCDGKAAEDRCLQWGQLGVCIDDGAGGLSCEIRGVCYGLEVGAECTENGNVGTCVDDGSGVLWCSITAPCEGKNPGDVCIENGNDGICTDGGGYMYCQPVPACDGKVAGDECTENGSSGFCTDGGGYLFCQPIPACDGKVAGDECTEWGSPGICTDNGGGYLYCQPVPVCPAGANSEACPGMAGIPGFCMDNLSGYAYCQSVVICEGLDEGDRCLDLDVGAAGVCEAVTGGLVCRLDNPCTVQGEACTLGGRFDGNSANSTGSGAGDRMVIDPGSGNGSCEYSDAGLLYCMQRGVCWGLTVGDACEENGNPGTCTDDGGGNLWCQPIPPCHGKVAGDACVDWGNPGTCTDDGGGGLWCQPIQPGCSGGAAGDACTTLAGLPGLCTEDERGDLTCIEVDPCMDRTAGEACQVGNGITGTCTDVGAGVLFCRPDSACKGKAAGDACTNSADQLPGLCTAAAGDQLVCQPTPPCADKDAGDACTAAGGFSGTCSDLGLGGALFCNANRPGGALHAVSTDACGNIYVGEAGTRTLWRFTPEGEAQLVASDLRAPITGLLWGGGAGGWDAMTLYAGTGGGAGVTAIPLALPGRPVVTPKRSDVRPSSPPDDPELDCLNLPDGPLEVNELRGPEQIGPRGYHDITFDDRGWMVGSNGIDLVAVSSANAFQPVLSDLGGVQGLAALPDGTIVAATDGEGLITIAPNGARDTLASEISAYGVSVGPDGMVYAADHAKVHRINPATKIAEVFLDPADFNQSWQPRTIAFDPDYSLMYIGSFGDSVYVVALDADLNRVGVPRKLGRVVQDGMYLDAFVVDQCGNLYFANYGTSNLYRLSPDGVSQLYHDWVFEQYGHGGDWGVAAGGWRTDAIYMPQPYDSFTVTEVVVGIPGVGR